MNSDNSVIVWKSWKMQLLKQEMPMMSTLFMLLASKWRWSNCAKVDFCKNSIIKTLGRGKNNFPLLKRRHWRTQPAQDFEFGSKIAEFMSCCKLSVKNDAYWRRSTSAPTNDHSSQQNIFGSKITGSQVRPNSLLNIITAKPFFSAKLGGQLWSTKNFAQNFTNTWHFASA